MNKPFEIKMSADQIEALIEGQKELKRSNDQLSTYILQLKTLISGNELDKHDRGMIGRLEKVEKNQEAAKKYAWMVIGGAAVIMFIIKYVLH